LSDYKCRRTAAESHCFLYEVFGNERWFQRFRDGDESLEDEEHQRCTEVVDSQELKEAVESDLTTTARELAQRFSCHRSTISDHFHAIGKKDRSGKWVPHHLSDTNKAARVAIAGILIRKTKNSNFYDSIVTSVDQALRRQGVYSATEKFLRARPHAATITLQEIEKLGWELLPHPPYSPDLTLSDYILFPSMQRALAEKEFKNHDEIEIWLSNFFKSQSPEFFKKGIHTLRRRWHKSLIISEITSFIKVWPCFLQRNFFLSKNDIYNATT
uniref:Histone-lysine N-methyltransferase SETMAR n=1 Tax=Heligmosomoides polygyrus TaxID=6339 RepID=A0A183GT96_HELPZ